MTKLLFQNDGDFVVHLCRGDREVAYMYPTHRVIDGEKIPIVWTHEKLAAYLQGVQKRNFPRSRQSDRWYWKIEPKPGVKPPGMIG